MRCWDIVLRVVHVGDQPVQSFIASLIPFCHLSCKSIDSPQQIVSVESGDVQCSKYHSCCDRCQFSFCGKIFLRKLMVVNARGCN